MSIGAIFLVREPVLRMFAFAAGLLCIAVAVGIWFFHPWVPGQSRAILLVPFVWGVLFLVSPLIFHDGRLRVALLTMAMGLPVIFSAVTWIACTFNFLSAAACG